MSKILEILEARKNAGSTKDSEPIDLRLSDKVDAERLKKLQTIKGIVQLFGQDYDLDLLPISQEEDMMFCFEGSHLAYYCEQRLRDRSAEDALMAVFMRAKRMICGKCGKLFSRCACYENIIFSGIMHRV